MKFVKKIFVLALAVMMITGIFSSLGVNAADITTVVPTIKVKAVKGTSIKVTINKTAEAQGYEISWNYFGNKKWETLYADYDGGTVDYLGYFKNGPYDSYVNSDNYFTSAYYTNYQKGKVVNNPYTLKKNGKKQRSVTFKNLQPGNYEIKVRAYNKHETGYVFYSKYSEVADVKLSGPSSWSGYQTRYDFSKVKVGEVIKFGAYEQDRNYTNGKEPIEWIVLSKSDGKLFLMSKYILDRLPYNKEYTSSTWETCTLRKWLNGAFYKDAFNYVEKGMIVSTTVTTPKNDAYGHTDGGKDTKDKVFLLSQYEVIDTSLGFLNNTYAKDELRKCTYAWEKGKTGNAIDQTADGETSYWWWTRSPGASEDCAAFVEGSGNVKLGGCGVYTEGGDCGVRPVIYINLKS